MDEETYCRLCAEPTPKEQLITCDDEVAKNSKIAAKMSWINIDISSSNILPNSICFSCFDLLERTWSFLHNVRSAQAKLMTIYESKKTVDASESIKQEDALNAGKPVDTDWAVFNAKKTSVKAETASENNIDFLTTVDPENILAIDFDVKNEYSDGDGYDGSSMIDTDGSISSDSDVPIIKAIKKKNIKKRKVKLEADFLSTNLQDTEAEPVDKSEIFITWDNFMCRCAMCNAQCKNIELLRLHSLQIHGCCCIFKCSDCGKVTPSYRMFIGHVRKHKKALRYACEICNEQFTMSANVKKHSRICHRDIFTNMCTNCGAYFENAHMLNEHLNIYNKKSNRRHEKLEDLKCDYCSKEFKTKSSLQQHRLVHTDRSRDFSCHVCGKMFYTKGTLRTHMLTHEDTKPYKCEFCPMAFRARGNLQSHISLHSGAKPFVCEQCGKSFRVKRHLKSHSIVHTDLMPYACDFCSKCFRFKTRLNLHLRQHTGAKPYNCIYCQRNFTNGSNYKKHMKRRHNIDTSRKKYNNVVDEQAISVEKEDSQK